MKKTIPLTVQTDKFEPGKIYIHPNDGYDLRLFSLNYQLPVFSNCSAEEFNTGEGDNEIFDIILSNDQPKGKIKMNHKFWETLDKPNEVVVINNKDRLLVLKFS